MDQSYASLTYIVECRALHAWFEPIAAFDVKSIAERYAAACKDVNASFSYRVRVAE